MDDVQFKWNIISDFQVQQKTDGKAITLLVDDVNCIGKSFTLQIIHQAEVISELQIQVVDAF